VTGFSINEELKDQCILLGASSCYTEFRSSGDLVCKYPCWYNKIILPFHLHKNTILILCSLVDDYLEELKFLGFEDILTEVFSSGKEKYIYYWIICEKNKFLEKDIIPNK